MNRLNLIATVFIITILSALFTSCDNNNQFDNEFMNEKEVNFSDNMLNFRSIEAYENYILNISNAPEKLKELQSINANPLRSNLKSANFQTENYEEVLLDLLSKDKLIRIGSWIIKVDMDKEIISLLHINNGNLINDLISDNNNDSIFKFAPEEEILELIETSNVRNIGFKSAERWRRCRDRKANSKHSKSSYTLREMGVRYYKAGVYFSLYAYITDIQTAYLTSSDNNHQNMSIDYKFDDRCNKSYSRGQTHTNVAFTYPRNPKTYKKRLYEHHRGLKNYKLDAKFTERVANSSGEIMATKSLSISDGI